MKNNKNLYFSIAALLFTISSTNLLPMHPWGPTDEAAAQRVEQMVENAQATGKFVYTPANEAPSDRLFEKRSDADFFIEDIQARLDAKFGGKKSSIPANIKGLISAHYPLSKKVVQALNTHTFRIYAPEPEVKEQKAVAAEAQAAQSNITTHVQN